VFCIGGVTDRGSTFARHFGRQKIHLPAPLREGWQPIYGTTR
jgi:hypothetical protein